MLSSYESELDFSSALAERLPEADAPTELRSALIDGITAGDADLQRERLGRQASDLELRLGPWFLRTDDTPYFESAGLIMSVGASLVATGGLPLPSVAAALTTLAAATWRIWRKGGRLTRAQTTVLTALEAIGPLSERQLEHVLAERSIDTDVSQVLASLRDVELHDGSSATLVRRTDDGRWRTVGV